MRIDGPEIDEFEKASGGPVTSKCSTCGETLLMRCGGVGWIDYPDGSSGKCVNLNSEGCTAFSDDL